MADSIHIEATWDGRKHARLVTLVDNTTAHRLDVRGVGALKHTEPDLATVGPRFVTVVLDLGKHRFTGVAAKARLNDGAWVDLDGPATARGVWTGVGHIL